MGPGGAASDVTVSTIRANPVLAVFTRGGVVESAHRGAFVAVDASGCELAQGGDIERAIFPRSAVKAMQCLAMVDAGAADRFGFGDEELALACASHSGEPHHVEVARRMLAAAGNSEEMYECGGHWPVSQAAAHDLISRHEWPHSIHNTCSGKIS